MTVYAKQVDKHRSSVLVREDRVDAQIATLSIDSHYACIQVLLDLFLPGMKRFTRSLELFGDIDASNSSFQILGTKAWFTTFGYSLTS